MRVLAAFADSSARDYAIARHAATWRGAVGQTGFELLELAARSPADAARALASEPGVLAAEPDERVALRLVPNDPLFETDQATGLGQWALRKTSVDRAWDTQRGSPAVIVATIDTGADPAHPDLAGALVAAPRFVSEPDPACPVDTTNRDDNGHGTHVSGIVAAAGNNGQGVAGVAFGVRVMPIKALDCTGAGFLSDIARSLTRAVDEGARIINVSLGSTRPSATLERAVQYALAKNVLVIAAAGNCGDESGTSRCPRQNAADYPAAYAGVLAVGATDRNDQPTAFSTAGTHIGISAPGTSILSTFPTYRVQLNGEGIPRSPYAVLRGTSQAAPIVAGVAALLVSREPSLPPSEVTQRLRSSADDVASAGYDTKTGDGRVNAVRALAAETALRYGARYQVQSPPTALANATSAALKVSITNTSSFTWPARGPNAVRVATHWYTAAGALVVWDGPRAALAADVPAGASVILEVPLSVPVPKGSYALEVDLVQDGVTWFSARDVPPLTLTVLVNAGYGASYQPARSSLSLATGSATSLAVTLTNTGSRAWSAAGAEPVRLASHLRDASGGAVVLWEGPRAPLAADVAPGATATVMLPVPAPPRPGVFALELDLVHEGVLWFSNEGVLTTPVALFVSSGGTRLYGARYAVASPPAQLPGGRLRVEARVTNTGALTWATGGATPIRVATHVLDARGAIVQWEGPRTSLSADVPPGATAVISLAIDAPRLPGTYRIRVDLVREGVSWFSSQGVEPLELALAVAVDRRASIALNVASVSRSSPQPIAVTVKNASGVALSSEGEQPVLVSSHWLAADGRVLLWDGPRAPLPRALRPGEEASLALPIASPPAGAVMLAVDLLQEGVAWFGTATRRTVTIAP